MSTKNNSVKFSSQSLHTTFKDPNDTYFKCSFRLGWQYCRYFLGGSCGQYQQQQVDNGLARCQSKRKPIHNIYNTKLLLQTTAYVYIRPRKQYTCVCVCVPPTYTEPSSKKKVGRLCGVYTPHNPCSKPTRTAEERNDTSKGKERRKKIVSLLLLLLWYTAVEIVIREPRRRNPPKNAAANNIFLQTVL